MSNNTAQNGTIVVANRGTGNISILDGVDTSSPVPHNVWLNGAEDRLFVTHSGAEASTVDVFSLEDPTTPVLIETIETEGLNPFGLAYAAPAAAELLVGTEESDRLQGGIENDLIFGEAGNDFLKGNDGDDKLFGREGRDKLTGGNGNDVLIGGNGNDALVGSNGNDLLIGVQVESFTPGAEEIDLLRGGVGQDTFVLGDALEVYYDDGNAHSRGLQDFAVIQDFNAHDDVIRLHGDASNYTLGTVHGSTTISYTAEGQTSELVAVVQNQIHLDIAGDAFEFSAV